MSLAVLAEPCSICPYRRDCPSGVWHREEYEKLPKYDTNELYGTFLCHHSKTTGRDTVCRGWLSVHRESVAARLAVLLGQITDEQRYAKVRARLFSTGQEAADAGIRNIEHPKIDAVRAIEKLARLRRPVRRCLYCRANLRDARPQAKYCNDVCGAAYRNEKRRQKT